MSERMITDKELAERRLVDDDKGQPRPIPVKIPKFVGRGFCTKGPSIFDVLLAAIPNPRLHSSWRSTSVQGHWNEMRRLLSEATGYSPGWHIEGRIHEALYKIGDDSKRREFAIWILSALRCFEVKP